MQSNRFWRGKISYLSTKSLVTMKTRNVQRGTLAFMPPEFLTGEIKEASNQGYDKRGFYQGYDKRGF